MLLAIGLKSGPDEFRFAEANLGFSAGPSELHALGIDSVVEVDAGQAAQENGQSNSGRQVIGKAAMHKRKSGGGVQRLRPMKEQSKHDILYKPWRG